LLKLKIYFLKLNKESVYIKLGRFSSLREMLSSKLCGYNLVVSRNGATCKLYSYILKLNVDWISLLVRGGVEKKVVHMLENICNDNNIDMLELKKIEIDLKIELEFALKCIEKYDVKYAFLNGDFEFRDRLFVMAMNLSKRKTFVFCHGYVQDPLFISINPFIVSKYLMWDCHQVTLMEKNGVEKDRLIDFGYPKSITDNTNHKNSIIFCCEPIIDNDVLNEDYISLLKAITIDLDSPIFVRLHPKETKSTLLIAELNKIPNIKISSRTLNEDFDRAKFVIGTNSSTLVEALYNGINSIQVKEFKKYDFPGVSVLKVENIVNVLTSKDDFSLYRNSINEPSIRLDSRIDMLISSQLSDP
ncbi:hypothetical protein, partial [Vibrio sp. 10N.261.54.A5]|uniref:hypothetical protein n=1 Tax=Vibrio sp. 10N.261.54.A5 TaxID=3229686 RepID=UPI00354C7A96